MSLEQHTIDSMEKANQTANLLAGSLIALAENSAVQNPYLSWMAQNLARQAVEIRDNISQMVCLADEEKPDAPRPRI